MNGVVGGGERVRELVFSAGEDVESRDRLYEG